VADVRLLPCGDTAVLLDCSSLAEASTWHDAITTAGLPMVEELVPGARTVLVRTAPGQTQAAQRAIRALQPPDMAEREATKARSAADPLMLDVVYDGDDLAEVGELTGLGADGVIEAHTGQVWRVAFCGFAPGFGYLVAEDDRLHVRRRAEPRTRVPAGAVGLAGEFSGVYPRASPGGWQLIGRTDAVLWDTERDPPALLAPGTLVRFRRC